MRSQRKSLALFAALALALPFLAQSARASTGHKTAVRHTARKAASAKKASATRKLVTESLLEPTDGSQTAANCLAPQKLQHWPEGNFCWPFRVDMTAISNLSLLPSFRFGSDRMLPPNSRAHLHIDSNYSGPLSIKVTHILGDHAVAHDDDEIVLNALFTNGVGDADLDFAYNGVAYYFEVGVPDGTVVPAGSYVHYSIYRLS